MTDKKCVWENRYITGLGSGWFYFGSCPESNSRHEAFWTIKEIWKFCPYCGKEIEVRDE